MNSYEQYLAVCKQLYEQLGIKHGDILVDCAYVNFPTYKYQAILYRVTIEFQTNSIIIKIININTKKIFFDLYKIVDENYIDLYVNIIKPELDFFVNLSNSSNHVTTTAECHI